MEDEQKQPPKEKQPKSLMWHILLWPITGIPTFWLCNWVFFNTLPPRNSPEIDLRAEIYSLMIAPIICFLIGAIVGARFARSSLGSRNIVQTAILLGFTTAALGTVYNLGACTFVIVGAQAFK